MYNQTDQSKHNFVGTDSSIQIFLRTTSLSNSVFKTNHTKAIKDFKIFSQDYKSKKPPPGFIECTAHKHEVT